MTIQATDRTIKTLSPRELRSFLFDIDNQDMTVAEMRAILFAMDDQRAEYDIDLLAERINNDAARSVGSDTSWVK